ncbi:MAG: VCBS repeat-containing protein [Bacteroidetes bacterium]|nr:VCBS repeat-containing protein [Bacteroidota bacterium]
MRYATLGLLLLPALVQAQTFTDASATLPSFFSFSFGATVVDVDGDGRTDIILAGELIRQTVDGFDLIDIDECSALGTLVADYDGDGRREVVSLCDVQALPARYDAARQVFAPITGSGIDTPTFFLIQGSVWLDDDRDGNLDLLLGDGGPPDVLLRNDGNGTFNDVSTSVLPGTEGGTYGMAAADFDRDGDPDVAIGLCSPNPSPNLLYRRGPTAFAEVAEAAGTDDSRASWGLVWLDYDGDGWLDLFVANTTHNGDGTNALFRNNGDGTFADVADAAGVAGPMNEEGLNAVAADFDNDGWIDILVANQPGPWWLWRNRGDGTFEDASASSGIEVLETLTIGVGDVNDDGWVDVVSAEVSAPILFLNDGGTNGWLSIRLRGIDSNPEGIGARIEVEAGGQTQVREITGGDGMMAQSHGLMAHFGLGTAQAADVTVRWPSGQVDVLNGVVREQHVTLVEGVGRNEPPAMFTLLSPEDGAAVDAWVTLTWEPATDPEGDPTTYTIHLSAPDGDDQTLTTTETSLAVSLGAIGDYHWAVIAEDAYTQRTSMDSFTFTNVTVSVDDDRPFEDMMTMRVWPNPSSGSVALTYTLPSPQQIRLEVVDALGRRRVWIEELGYASDGTHQIPLDLGRLSDGVYLLRLISARGEVVTRQFTQTR